MAHGRFKVFGVLLLLISLLALHIVDLVTNFLGHITDVDGDGWLPQIALRLHFDSVEQVLDAAGGRV